MEILKRITSADRAVVAVKDWKYESRRTSQEILSFLHLGPASVARELDLLRAQGITMLLVIRNTRTAQASLLSGEKAARQLGIEAASVDVAGNPELIAAFPRAARVINDHLISKYRSAVADDPQNPSQKSLGKILVFCESGNERSAAVVAAYLMCMYGMDMISAIQYIQSQRFCVAFDDGLKNLLVNYMDLLNAQRMVSKYVSSTPVVAQTSAKAKRGRDELAHDIEDMDLDNADDEERFGNRRVYAPFQ
jgi:serine/threonine/tyrosine-interacting protein